MQYILVVHICNLYCASILNRETVRNFENVQYNPSAWDRSTYYLGMDSNDCTNVDVDIFTQHSCSEMDNDLEVQRRKEGFVAISSLPFVRWWYVDHAIAV